MKTGIWLLVLPVIVAAFVVVMPELHAQTPTAAQAAQRLIEATAPAQRGELLLPFTDVVRSDWHYIPRRRDGLAWKAMSHCAARGDYRAAAHGAERARPGQGARA